MATRVIRSLKAQVSVTQNQLVDLGLMVLWPLIAALTTAVFSLSFIAAMVLFLGLPCVYLSVRLGQKIGRSLLFSTVMGVPLAIVIDYLMEVTSAWVVSESAFGDFRLFDHVFVEQIPWLVAFAFLTVLVYRRFVGQSQDSTLKRMPFSWFVAWHSAVFIGFVALWAINPQALVLDYAYLKVGMVLGAAPLLYVALTSPSLLRRFIVPTLFFAWYSGIYELISLDQGHWAFPDPTQFVGWITVVGHTLPFEEILFWMVLGPASCLSYFEIFGGEPT